MSAVSLSALRVDLGGAPVLRGVSCGIDSGGWLALIGPNGAGKSTLLRAAAGLLPYRGTVVLDGTDLCRLSHRSRARLIAFVPQSPVLPPDMTAGEYVLLGRTPHLGYLSGPGRADRRIAAEASARLDVSHFSERRLATLSGGELQRVVLARALAQRPTILLLDEPTTALDIGHQQQVLELVDDLRRADGLTVVTTLHDLTAAGQYASSLVLLHEGLIVASGPADTVLTEERIEAVYSARVVVRSSPDGSAIVTPVRPRLASLALAGAFLERGPACSFRCEISGRGPLGRGGRPGVAA